jgi:hypothetical protein
MINVLLDKDATPPITYGASGLSVYPHYSMQEADFTRLVQNSIKSSDFYRATH